MGWFWADTASSFYPPAPSHRRSKDAASPPPGCPMHRSPASPSSSSPPATVAAAAEACPYNKPASSAATSATPSYISKLNPLNYMPTNISNERQSSHQSINLPLEREASTIPRGDGQGTWEYPSPQQMYNAMLRKGYTDTPAEHVESMVAVHNFLNEGAWDEIKEWERRFAGGLGRGWEVCRRGEQGAERQLAIDALRRRRAAAAGAGKSQDYPEPTLLRFTGRPDELTPKARLLAFMARIYPSQFPDNPPFDRHDWFVERHGLDGGSREVRYVIDYYSGPPEITGEPVFYLDVRPAVDGPTAACERLMRWGGDVWWRASGGSVREEIRRQKVTS